MVVDHVAGYLSKICGNPGIWSILGHSPKNEIEITTILSTDQ